MNDRRPATGDQPATARRPRSGPAPRVPRPASAFTLIEIMIVLAIIGLIAAMGVPSLFQIFRKEGMRRAVSDVQQLLSDARLRAISSGRSTEIVFHPAEKRLEIAGASGPPGGASANNSGFALPTVSLSGSLGSVMLPYNVDIAMLDVDMLDRGGDERATVAFYPDGTCQELTLVLHSGDEWEKITLEYATALASVGPMTR